jgi:hypothetical protein
MINMIITIPKLTWKTFRNSPSLSRFFLIGQGGGNHQAKGALKRTDAWPRFYNQTVCETKAQPLCFW